MVLSLAWCNHAVCTLTCLVSFAQRCVSRICPCCLCSCFFLLGCVANCERVPHQVCSFCRWQMLVLCLLFCNYKTVNTATCLLAHFCVHFCWVSRSGIDGAEVTGLLSISRYRQDTSKGFSKLYPPTAFRSCSCSGSYPTPVLCDFLIWLF